MLHTHFTFFTAIWAFALQLLQDLCNLLLLFDSSVFLPFFLPSAKFSSIISGYYISTNTFCLNYTLLKTIQYCLPSTSTNMIHLNQHLHRVNIYYSTKGSSIASSSKSATLTLISLVFLPL